MIRTIYVEQYGWWWKLTPEQWRALCTGGAAGHGHQLPEKSLRRRSALVGATGYNDGRGKKSYFPLRDGIRVYSPLDWEADDYREALRELDAASEATQKGNNDA